MVKKVEAARMPPLEETDKRLENAQKLAGKLELIIEIQDKFLSSWGVLAPAKDWNEFTKPYMEQKV